MQGFVISSFGYFWTSWQKKVKKWDFEPRVKRRTLLWIRGVSICAVYRIHVYHYGMREREEEETDGIRDWTRGEGDA